MLGDAASCYPDRQDSSYNELVLGSTKHFFLCRKYQTLIFLCCAARASLLLIVSALLSGVALPVLLGRGWGAQGEVAQRLASLGMEFSEEALEPVTGYRVDILLHGGGDGATGRCAVEVGIYINLLLLLL